MEKNSVPKATLGRLPGYLQHLRAVFDNNCEFISATAIAKSLSLGEVQVRKDLNTVSGAGKPKIGYVVKELIECIEDTLGYNNLTNAVIVGAGRLGRALLNYEGFMEYGVDVKAAFDIQPEFLDFDESQKEVLPMDSFDSYCKSKNIKIGIITVNAGSAQQVCVRMIQNGIKAIWNFTPSKLCVPDGILLKQENLALSLAYLNNQLGNQN
mgnify:CR=1 FL=1